VSEISTKLESEFFKTIQKLKHIYFHRERGIENIAPHHFFILFTIHHLSKCEGVIYPYMISEKMGITRSAVTQSLNFLEKNNYVKRTIDENDRRKFKVKMTFEGENMLKKIHEAQMKRTEYIVNRLGGDKTRMIMELCDELIGINKEYNEEVR